MQFQLPQFIEKETGFLGPLTIRQTVIFAFAAGGVLFAWLLFGKSNFMIFIIISILLVSGAAALSFLKINGLNLTTVLKNFLSFLSASKLYLWNRKEVSVYYEKKAAAPAKKELKAESPLKIASTSKIKDLNKKIEFGG
jgi:membrane protein implicated in regulation of membrane protease activity